MTDVVGRTIRTASPPSDSAGRHVICIAENRANCEPALRILVASLARHSPDCPVRLFAPNATPAFVAWIARHAQVRLSTQPFRGGWDKYDVKPKALLALLDEGVGSAVWIDSDIMVTCDFRTRLTGLRDDEIVVTEEALGAFHADEDAARARGWRMPVGRALPFGANSGVVRVTQAHRTLLVRWQELLESAEYRAAQALPWDRRPVHCLGDQEVLTALLCSAPFAHLPVRLLRRGRDIIQYFGASGYTVRERVRNLASGLPPFVHSQGFRPWWPRGPIETQPASAFVRLYYELSPYTLLARRYADALEDAAWLRPPTRASRLLGMLSFGNAALIGMPLAAIADVRRIAIAARSRRTPKPQAPARTGNALSAR